MTSQFENQSLTQKIKNLFVGEDFFKTGISKIEGIKKRKNIFQKMAG